MKPSTTTSPADTALRILLLAALGLALVGCVGNEEVVSEDTSDTSDGSDATDQVGADTNLCSEFGAAAPMLSCLDTGCPTGQVCDQTQGCYPSACNCDPATGQWQCTADCMGGLCVPVETLCPAPNPVGCMATGCGVGLVCRITAECASSACGCDPGTGDWICTPDCSGGVCVPEAEASCTTDGDCMPGATWCEGGLCVGCDNSGLVCDLACVDGTVMETRNGCHPCNCVAENQCESDAGCNIDQRCKAGEFCLTWCPAGDPACCRGNLCVDVTPCASDADCAAGAEWCEGGACVACDNSGTQCLGQCDAEQELKARNGCLQCECVPTNACTADADCGAGQSCLPGAECLTWCPAGDPSCCYGNTCGTAAP